jgi:predicted metal-dependent hydrolase
VAVKKVLVDGVGEVALYKRRGLRTMKLSVRANGEIRVSLPSYVPYQAAVQFVQAKRGWLETHRPLTDALLENAQAIGKQHALRFIANFHTNATKSRVTADEVIVTHPAQLSSDDDSVQKTAGAAAVRALRQEAEAILPSRVARIAKEAGFVYRSVVIKKLTGRWGSCDQNHNIVLNLYLMQLPWELIDYVIMHELVHTRHLDHGEGFWNTFETHLSGAKALRRRMRAYQPNLLLPAANQARA